MKTKPMLILVAGGSASGKSTVVEEIVQKAGLDDVSIIKHDDYYLPFDDLPMDERVKINYDHPSAFDNKLLNKHLKQLLSGNSINKPIYDYINFTRSKSYENVTPKKNNNY